LLGEVLQSDRIYTSVATGNVAPDSLIRKCFQNVLPDPSRSGALTAQELEAVAIFMLRSGSLALSAAERAHATTARRREVAERAAALLRRTDTGFPIPADAVAAALASPDVDFDDGRIPLDKPLKPVVLAAVRALTNCERLGLERAPLLLAVGSNKVREDSAKRAALRDALAAAVDVTFDEATGGTDREGRVVFTVSPADYKEVEAVAGRYECHVEVMETAVRRDTDLAAMTTIAGAGVGGGGGGGGGGDTPVPQVPTLPTAAATIVSVDAAARTVRLKCTACKEEFTSRDEHRAHYKSARHRENLQRKVAGLGPLARDAAED